MAAPAWNPAGVGSWPPTGLSGGLHSRLLGFVKTALLRQLVPPNALVCDLFCGRGLDTERWAEAGIGRYVGVDLSASALEEAQEQWEQHDKPFPAEFCELDPCMVDLEAHLQDQDLPADIVSCLAHLQDSFTSEEMVKRLLKNVAAVLKPGGFFFGTTPDSSTIWYKYQKAVQEAMKAGSLRVNGTLPSVRTDNYKITFDDDRFLPFGSKYHMRFTDDGLPAHPQLLVHFPSLIRLAKEVGLECVEIQNLMEFYDDYSGPFADVLRSCCGSLVDLKGAPVLDAKARLSGQAMDVLSLFTTFIFKKGDSAMSTMHVSPSSEHAFKASNSASKYLTNFPSQHSETLSYSMNDETGRKNLETIKVEDSGALLAAGTPLLSMRNEQPHRGSHSHNGETDVVDPSKELSEVMRDASLGQNICDNADVLDNQTEGQLDGLTEKDFKKKHSNQPKRSSLQLGRLDVDGHPAVEHVFEHPVGDREFKTWPSKEASNSGSVTSTAMEREELHHQMSTTRGHRTSRGLNGGGHPTSIEPTQLMRKYIEFAEEVRPPEQFPHHSQGTGEKLDGSSKVGQNEDPRPADHSPNHFLRGTSESLEDSSRGEEQQEPTVMGRSPKHYMRRVHEKSSRRKSQQELSQGTHTSKHYLPRTYESEGEGNRKEKKQNQPVEVHFFKGQTRRTLESLDKSSRRNKKKELSPQGLPSRHYEQRGHDNLDNRSRTPKHLDPPATDNSSKQYMQRTPDSSKERNIFEQDHEKKGRLEGGSSKWAGRSRPEQDSRGGLQSSQGGRNSQVVLKKNLAANFGKPTAITRHVEDDVMTPHPI